eukprot:Nitzschia sp. Nitz4//scaffold178_size73299//26025//26339//NITZ4_005701-RA/size73299-processed-gene-0.4-mRNA-1//1//CDS//3329539128//8938//frame0
MPLVESLTSGDRSEIGGILCNDVNGLCLVSKGNMSAQANSGVYSNMVRLASQLSPNQSSADANNAPLITIECDTSTFLVKDYNGHAVALRVPSTSDAPAPSESL